MFPGTVLFSVYSSEQKKALDGARLSTQFKQLAQLRTGCKISLTSHQKKLSEEAGKVIAATNFVNLSLQSAVRKKSVG